MANRCETEQFKVPLSESKLQSRVSGYQEYAIFLSNKAAKKFFVGNLFFLLLRQELFAASFA